MFQFIQLEEQKNAIDSLIDLELWAGTLIYKILSIFYFFNDFSSYPRDWMNNILSLNYQLSHDFSLLRKYYDSLYNYVNSQSDQLENVIIIGHSLGGGLAKLIALRTDHSVISFSGGGTEILEEYFGGGNVFKASRQINVVPEQDIVPRIGKLDGEILPLPCQWGPAECHKIGHTACQIAYICDEKDVMENYCEKLQYQNKTKILENIKEVAQKVRGNFKS